MSQEENKEELNVQETDNVTEQPTEQVPAEEQVEETKLDEKVESTEGEVKQPEKESKEELVDLQNKLAKAEEERDNYKDGMLQAKGKNRVKELNSEEPEVQTDSVESSEISRDYQSKRADIIAENDDKFKNLSDDEFKALSNRLKTSEQVLINDLTSKNKYVARKQIQDIINEELDYVDYKFGHRENNQEPQQNSDIGSTKTIRKLQPSAEVSDEAKEISKFADGTSPERIDEMRRKGYQI